MQQSPEFIKKSRSLMQKVNSLESFTLNRKEKARSATSYYFVYSIQFWFFDTRSRLQKQSPNKKGVQKQFNFSKKTVTMVALGTAYSCNGKLHPAS